MVEPWRWALGVKFCSSVLLVSCDSEIVSKLELESVAMLSMDDEEAPGSRRLSSEVPKPWSLDVRGGMA